MHTPLVDEATLSLINSTLDNFFTDSKERASKIDPSYERLWTNLHDLLRSGGKRIRPQLTLLGYSAFGGNNPESIIPVAAAQELLHFSLLIHDDVIDRDYIRYGVDNIAGQYKKTYSQFISSENDLTHFSHSTAILAGDLMLSGAHQLISASELPGETVAVAQQHLSAGIFEVAGGELLDTELSFMPYTKGDALKVANYKTASYSFISPLLTGASLAGASEEQRKILKNYARYLGIAYQLTDDLLGIFGDEKRIGKSTTSDLIEGKRTYLIEKALESLSSTEQHSFMATLGNPNATPSKMETAKQLLRSSGAEREVTSKIAEYTDKAHEHLNLLKLPYHHHDKFLNLLTQVTSRST